MALESAATGFVKFWAKQNTTQKLWVLVGLVIAGLLFALIKTKGETVNLQLKYDKLNDTFRVANVNCEVRAAAAVQRQRDVDEAQRRADLAEQQKRHEQEKQEIYESRSPIIEKRIDKLKNALK